ncbi:MAG TPA: Na/Pi cotransporter family protein [Nitrospirota bacterium]|nr:Na/Pi cotransporter family protein [Nitrospirota bacterium]
MIIVSLFGGVLLLLYGIRLLNDGLQNAAGSKIRSLLRSLTSNRLSAVGAGAFLTGLIQSSSATSVMLVGFVSAGLMTFRQTLAVVLGADIGATLTVQLIAFHITDYAILIIGAGLALVLFSKKRFSLSVGDGLLGFGFVFLSLKIMIEAMEPLQGNELFRQVFAVLSETPFIGIVLAAVLTAFILSSAATMGIALALAKSGLIPLPAAISIVLGANIGTCATALIASLRSPAEARRVAWAHVLFKVFGVILFLPFLGPYETLVASTASDLPRQIANAHTLFNVIIAVLFLPLTGLFAKLIIHLVPEKAEEKKFGPLYLDEHVLGTPAIALGQATREALRASDIVREMLVDSVTVFQTDDPSTISAIKDKDNLIDLLDRHIRLYITRLSSGHLTESQTRRAMTVLEISRDLESIGDIVDRNVMPLALKRIKKGITFSQEGLDEIIAFHKKVLENFDIAVTAFSGNDRDLADRVLRAKEELGALERELVQAHLDRLRKGFRESIETSHIHLDLIGNLARINSLITHIIYPIVEEKRVRGREDVGIEAL